MTAKITVKLKKQAAAIFNFVDQTLLLDSTGAETRGKLYRRRPSFPIKATAWMRWRRAGTNYFSFMLKLTFRHLTVEEPKGHQLRPTHSAPTTLKSWPRH